MDNQERNELEARTEKKKKELIDWKAKQSESAEWQYANCWTTASDFLKLTGADVVLIQEARVAEGHACDYPRDPGEGF